MHTEYGMVWYGNVTISSRLFLFIATHDTIEYNIQPASCMTSSLQIRG